MCLIAIHMRVLAGFPVLVAANREEDYRRPSLRPQLHDGPPRVLCGVDVQAGGTWLGINEHGLIVAVTNRTKRSIPTLPRSRGLLCRELLGCESAVQAAQNAQAALAGGQYAGANFVCLDQRDGFVVHGGDRLNVVELSPGLHLVTNGDLDDPGDVRAEPARQLFGNLGPASLADYVTTVRRVCAYHRPNAPSILLRGQGRGTVSSSLIALAQSPHGSQYLHAEGPPDSEPYEDLSRLLPAPFSEQNIVASGSAQYSTGLT